MDDDEDHLHHDDDSIILEPIIAQHDDEMTTSTLNSFRQDERQTHEDTLNLAPNRRGVRVKFAYSFDNDRLLPITQTTIIKTEPCFKVIATEDPVTKHFYHNESQVISTEHQTSQFVLQRTPSEADSLEDEYIPKFTKEKKSIEKERTDRVSSSSSPVKSILKKAQKKEETSIPKLDRSSVSRSPSPSSLKKKSSSSTRLDFNEVQHLAEITAKQNSSPSLMYPRSLFDQTINIFDPDNSYRIISNVHRSSRNQYYIKPYRGEANLPTNTSKQRSRSLSQQSGTTNRWHTFSNQYSRPSTRQSNRKQHVSWSPVREYIHQEKDSTVISSTTRKERPYGNVGPTLLSTDSSLSSSSPCLQSSLSVIPTPARYQSSRSFQVHQSSSSSTDSYEAPSFIDRALITPITQQSYEKENEFITRLPDTAYQHQKEHEEKMQRYDRLLEKMRTTDEQLQALSRSWTNNTQQRIPVNVDRRSSLSVNKTTIQSHFFTPMMLQMCLIILVIFNLFVAYFFNEIHVWWSQYVVPTVIVEQHDEDTLNY